jgi:uncharacterized membrane protein YjfL (UPF0719 family)
MFDIFIRYLIFLAVPSVTFCLFGIIYLSVKRRYAPLPAKLGIIALSIMLGGELFRHAYTCSSMFGLSWAENKYLPWLNYPLVEYIRYFCTALLVYSVMSRRGKQVESIN